MVAVRDVKEFVSKNQNDLVRFFRYKTGISDRDMIDDHIQEFYVRLINTGALQKYREDKGSFSSYILNLFCWTLPVMAKKNVSVRHVFITNVSSDVSEEPQDIYDHVGPFNGPYRVAEVTESVSEQPDDLMEYYINEFFDYIKRTESKSWAEKLIQFIMYKKSGFNSAEIARIMGKKDSWINKMKKDIKRKLYLWERMI